MHFLSSKFNRCISFLTLVAFLFTNTSYAVPTTISTDYKYSKVKLRVPLTCDPDLSKRVDRIKDLELAGKIDPSTSVEQAIERYFGVNSTTEDEVRLVEFLAEKGEEDIHEFVNLICKDRQITKEEFGLYYIPEYKEEEYPRRGEQSQGEDGRYYPIPCTKGEFERERLRLMAEVAIQRALGRKIVTSVGIGNVGTAMMCVTAETEKDIGEKELVSVDSQTTRFRRPLSGKVNPYFMLGYQRPSTSSYAKIELVNNGKVPIKTSDTTVEPIIREARARRNMRATFLAEGLAVADIVLIETEVDIHKIGKHLELVTIALEQTDRLIKQVASLAPKDATFIVESTTFAGFTRDVVTPILEKGFEERGIKFAEGEHPKVAYSPQILQPGPQWLLSLKIRPRKGCGITDAATSELRKFFTDLGFNFEITATVEEAEYGKSLDNAWFYSLLEIMDSYLEVAEEIGVDGFSVIRGIMLQGREYQGGMKYISQLQPGGFCVPKEIGFIIEQLRRKGLDELEIMAMMQSRILAAEINDFRAYKALDRYLLKAFAAHGKKFKGSRLGVLGVAYKGEANDTRKSGSQRLANRAAHYGMRVEATDPFARRWPEIIGLRPFDSTDWSYELSNQAGLRTTLRIKYQPDEGGYLDFVNPEQDALVISTPHKQYYGKSKPEKDRAFEDSDGNVFVSEGMDPIKVGARMLGLEGKIILDTYDYFGDEEIKTFLALGWDVRAIGKGHINGLKEKLTIQERITAVRDLIKELERLSYDNILREAKEKGAQLEKGWLERALITAHAKLEYLVESQKENPDKDRISLLEAKYEYAKAVQEECFSKEDERRVIQAKRNYYKYFVQYLESSYTGTVTSPDMRKLSTQVKRFRTQYNNLLKEQYREAAESLAEAVIEPVWKEVVADAEKGGQAMQALSNALKGERFPMEDVDTNTPEGIGEALQRAMAACSYLAETVKTILDTMDRVHKEVLTPDQRRDMQEEMHQLKSRPELTLSGRTSHTGEVTLTWDGKDMRFKVGNQNVRVAGVVTIPITTTGEALKFKTQDGDIIEVSRDAELIIGALGVVLNMAGKQYSIMDKNIELKLTPDKRLILRVGQNAVRLFGQITVPIIASADEDIVFRAPGRDIRIAQSANLLLTPDKAVQLQIGGEDFRIRTGDVDLTQITASEAKRGWSIEIQDRVHKNDPDLEKKRIAELKAKGIFVIYRDTITDENGDMLEFVPFTFFEKGQNGRLTKQEDPEGFSRARTVKWLIDAAKGKNGEMNPLWAKAMIKVPLNLAAVTRESFIFRPKNSKQELGRIDIGDGEVVGFSLGDYIVYFIGGWVKALKDRKENNVLEGFNIELIDDYVVFTKISDREEIGRVRIQGDFSVVEYVLPGGYKVQISSGKIDRVLDAKGKDVTNDFNIEKREVTDDFVPELYPDFARIPVEYRDWFIKNVFSRKKITSTVKGEKQQRFYELIDVNPDSPTVARGRGGILMDGETNQPVYITTEQGVEMPIMLKASGAHQEMHPAELRLDTSRVIQGGMVIDDLFTLKHVDTEEELGVIEMYHGRVVEFPLKEGYRACIVEGRIETVKDKNEKTVLFGIEKQGDVVIINNDAGEELGRVTIDEGIATDVTLPQGYILHIREEEIKDVIDVNGKNVLGDIERKDKPSISRQAMPQLSGHTQQTASFHILKKQWTPAYSNGDCARAVFRGIFRYSLNPEFELQQLWRAVPSTRRIGWMLFGDDTDYDPVQMTKVLAWNSAEILGGQDDKCVHIAPNPDNLYGVAPNHWTDEDSEIPLFNERDPYGAFFKYFGYSMQLVHWDFEAARKKNFDATDLTYFPIWVDAFLDHFLEIQYAGEPLVRHPEKFNKFRRLVQAVTKENLREFEVSFMRTIWDECLAYYVLMNRLDRGYEPRKDTTHTISDEASNYDPNDKRKAIEFIDKQRELLQKAQRLIEKDGYRPLYRENQVFDFDKAYEELDRKRELIDLLSAQKKRGNHYGDIYNLSYYSPFVPDVFSVLDYEAMKKDPSEIRLSLCIAMPTLLREKMATRLAPMMSAAEGRVNELFFTGLDRFPEWGEFPLVPVYFDAWLTERDGVPAEISTADDAEDVYYLLMSDYLTTSQTLSRLQRLGFVTFQSHPVKVGNNLYFYYERGGIYTYVKVDINAQKTVMIDKQTFERETTALEIKQEKLPAETVRMMVKGTKGDMELVLNVSPGSKVVSIFVHGLAGDVNDGIGTKLDELQDEIGISTVRYTSSRYQPMPRERSPEIFDRVFGKMGTAQAKTMDDEVEELRRVINTVISTFEAQGVSRDELEIVLVGRSQGGQIVPQLAHEFPQVKGMVLIVASMEDFSATGLPKEQRHSITRTPPKEVVGGRFKKFEGSTIVILGTQDMPERNDSAKGWASYLNPRGNIRYFYIDDEHAMRKPESREKIKDFVTEFISQIPHSSILQRYGYDGAREQPFYDGYRSGKISLATNRMSLTDEINPPTVGDMYEYDVKRVAKDGTEEQRLDMEAGAEGLSQARLGVVVPAGGLWTRGADISGGQPKGVLELIEIDGKKRSLIECRTANVAWARQEFGGRVHLGFMTSFGTDGKTKEYLADNGNFGLKGDLDIYGQGITRRLIPTFSDLREQFGKNSVDKALDGTITEADVPKGFSLDDWKASVIESKDHAGEFYTQGNPFNPPGHLDTLGYLILNGTLLKWIDEGVKDILVPSLDDIPGGIDPKIYGAFLRSGKDLISEVVGKSVRLTLTNTQTNENLGTILLVGGEFVSSSISERYKVNVQPNGDIVSVIDANTGEDIKDKLKVDKKEDAGGLPVVVNGEPLLKEQLTFPKGFDQKNLVVFNAFGFWMNVGTLLKAFGFNSIEEYRTSFNEPSHKALLEKVNETYAMSDTIVGIKIDAFIGKDGTEHKRPVAQKEQLIGDILKICHLRGLRTHFLMIPKPRYSQFKTPDDAVIKRADIIEGSKGRLLFSEQLADIEGHPTPVIGAEGLGWKELGTVDYTGKHIGGRDQDIADDVRNNFKSAVEKYDELKQEYQELMRGAYKNDTILWEKAGISGNVYRKVGAIGLFTGYLRAIEGKGFNPIAAVFIIRHERDHTAELTDEDIFVRDAEFLRMLDRENLDYIKTSFQENGGAGASEYIERLMTFNKACIRIDFRNSMSSVMINRSEISLAISDLVTDIERLLLDNDVSKHFIAHYVVDYFNETLKDLPPEITIEFRQKLSQELPKIAEQIIDKDLDVPVQSLFDLIQEQQIKIKMLLDFIKDIEEYTNTMDINDDFVFDNSARAIRFISAALDELKRIGVLQAMLPEGELLNTALEKYGKKDRDMENLIANLKQTRKKCDVTDMAKAYEKLIGRLVNLKTMYFVDARYGRARPTAIPKENYNKTIKVSIVFGISNSCCAHDHVGRNYRTKDKSIRYFLAGVNFSDGKGGEKPAGTIRVQRLNEQRLILRAKSLDFDVVFNKSYAELERGELEGKTPESGFFDYSVSEYRFLKAALVSSGIVDDEVEDMKKVTESLRKFTNNGGLELSVSTELPESTGLGISGYLGAALLLALDRLQGKDTDLAEFGDRGLAMEHNFGKQSGYQDWRRMIGGSSAFKICTQEGGPGLAKVNIEFLREVNAKEAEEHLVLVNARFTRSNTGRLGAVYSGHLARDRKAFQAMKDVVWVQKALHEAFRRNDFETIGKLETMYQQCRDIMDPTTDEDVLEAIGAMTSIEGLSGAAFTGSPGGTMMLWCKDGQKPKVIERLKALQSNIPILSKLEILDFVFTTKGYEVNVISKSADSGVDTIKEARRYGDDSEMKYNEQVYQVMPDAIAHKPFIYRFLPLINPTHELVLAPENQEGIKKEKERGKRISLVYVIPKEQLEKSSGYQDLMEAIKNSKAFKNEKIDLMPEDNIHFTIRGKLEVVLQQENLTEKALLKGIRKELEGKGEIWMAFKGLWFNTFIKARGFLKGYSEIDEKSANKLSDLIALTGGEDFRVYAPAILQLKDYLTQEEADELNEIVEKFKDRTIVEYPIRELKVLSFENDLLGDKREIGVITLESRKPDVGSAVEAVGSVRDNI